ncbi:hypothetical protein PAXINDRAFT_118299 [Paxillus involutus ATCC 200175]|uniref:Asparagine--tRNA ligase, mitochondrial n=1 Tax=Paxillus involutus ATCC 200175 TaxID=664439 RepID=A0A0C9TNX3_PAXIN|nr:hypothetical protein PAXINDRAFT_118299 [Paxillus involutus ATCC 200175]
MFLKRFSSTSAWTLPQTIRQILSSGQQPPSKIHVHGWVKSVRRQKNVTFAVINDGSCVSGLQAVLTHNSNPTLHALTNGASVRMTGSIVASRGSGQAKELQVDSVEVLGECNPETYPIQKQALSVEYLRDHAHLRPRTDANASMLRLRSSLLRSLHDFFERHDFCYAHTPILTSSDCEGAGETFRVTPSSTPSPSHQSPAGSPPPDPHSEFFSHPAYLTVSSQLHLEALAASLARVYTLSPCFRAEPSQTNRHLAEFWMLEAEWAWTRGVDDVCGLVEACAKHALGAGGDERALLTKGIAGHEERLRSLEAAAGSESWARMTYTEAIAELEKYHASSDAKARPFVFEPKWGQGLQSEHEKWLSEVLIKGPVFVTDYPSSVKPFYMRMNDDERTVACFDLLVPYVGELVGGSLREERLDALKKRMSTHALDPEGEEYGWYVDLRRFGSAPHGGFGMGFERLVSWVSGIENVRECIAMPRWAKRMLL